MTPNKFLTACVDDKTDLACKRARADCTTTNTHIQLNAHTHTLPLSLSPASSRRLLLARSLLGHENSSIFPAVWKNACEIHSNQARIFTHGYHKKHTLERRAGGEREFSTEENAIQWQQQQAHTRQGRSDRRERTSRRKTDRKSVV